MNANVRENNPTPTDHRIQIMMNLFKGRTDTFGLYVGGPGVRPLRAKSPITEKDYRLHIKGDKFHRIGIYPDVDGYVKWAMIDVDEKDKKTGIVDWAKAKAAVNAIVFYLKENGLHPHVEISKSKGYHIWVFFDEPILAGVVRAILQDIIQKAGEKEREIFPKQAETGDGFGNFAALPLHGGSIREGLTIFLNPDLTPIADQWKYLESPSLTKVEDMEELYRSLEGEPKPHGREPPPSPGPMFDVPKYLLERGVRFTIKQDLTKTLYLLPECFWADQHTTPDGHGDSAVIQDATGLITYHCFHTHCQARTWRDVRDLLEERETASFQAPSISSKKSTSFPDNIMSGVAGDFATLYSKYIESPKVFSYFGFLVCLGSILSGRLILKSERPFQPRYYILLLGESADDRKSTAIDTPTEFFKEFFPNELHTCWGVGSAEGLQLKIEATPGGRLLLCLDEFKALIGKCKIDGSVLLPALNTLFEKNFYESRTKSSDIQLKNAHLSILGASTTATYENLWTSQFIDIGFPNRLFIVPGTGKKKNSIPERVPHYLKQDIKTKTQKIIDLIGDNFEIDADEGGKEEFNKWYLSLDDNKSVHTKRLDTYALRLMPLLAVNDFKTAIDLETVQKTIRIMEWQREVREEFDPIDATNEVAKMEERIRRRLKINPHSTGDLKHYTKVSREGIWVFNMAVKNLSEGDNNEIRLNKVSKKWELI